MIKRAVNDVINVLTKLNKLNLKEKVYLLVFFVVLYFVVKMVMKQFFVTEHLTSVSYTHLTLPTICSV